MTLGLQGSLNALKSFPEPQNPKRHHRVTVFKPLFHSTCHHHVSQTVDITFFYFFFTLPLLLSFNLILYFIQPRLFPPCYDNGRELSMFNEWLEAGYRFRNILVTVNTRSSSIICSHTVVFHGSSAKCAPTEAQIYFGRVSCSFARCMFSADVGFPE